MISLLGLWTKERHQSNNYHAAHVSFHPLLPRYSFLIVAIAVGNLAAKQVLIIESTCVFGMRCDINK